MAIIPLPNLPNVSRAQPAAQMDVRSAGAVGRAAAGATLNVLNAAGTLMKERQDAQRNIFLNRYQNDKRVLDQQMQEVSAKGLGSAETFERHQALIEAFQENYSDLPRYVSGEFGQKFADDFAADSQVFGIKANILFDKALDIENVTAYRERLNAAGLEMLKYEGDKNSEEYKAAKSSFDALVSEFATKYGVNNAEIERQKAYQAGLHGREAAVITNPMTSIEEIQQYINEGVFAVEGMDVRIAADLRRIGREEIVRRRKQSVSEVMKLRKMAQDYKRDPENNPPPTQDYVALLEMMGAPREAVQAAQSYIDSLGEDFVQQGALLKSQKKDNPIYNRLVAKYDERILGENPLLSDAEYEADIAEIMDSNLVPELKSELLLQAMALASNAARESNVSLLPIDFVAEELSPEERALYVTAIDYVKSLVAQGNLRVTGRSARRYFQNLDNLITKVAEGKTTFEEFRAQTAYVFMDESLRDRELQSLGIAPPEDEIVPGAKLKAGDQTFEYVGDGIWELPDGSKFKKAGNQFIEIIETQSMVPELTRVPAF